MNSSAAADLFAALSHIDRLELFRLLVRRLPGRVMPAELINELGIGASMISAHLRVLDGVGLVSRVREGRTLRYRAELGELASLGGFLLDDCCQGRIRSPLGNGNDCCCVANRKGTAPSSPSVLFIDTRNEALSLMADVVLDARHPGCCHVFSAGLTPARRPCREAMDALRSAGYDVAERRPASVRRLFSSDASPMDIVITLSADVANPTKRVWPGAPIVSHWEIPGTPESTEREPFPFGAMLDALERRIDAFVDALGCATDRVDLQRAVDGTDLDLPAAARSR